MLAVLVLLTVQLGVAADAFALRAANYGMDFTTSPYDEHPTRNRMDAAERSAYYQGLMGFTTMNRSRALGRNIYEKLNDTDPTGHRYLVVQVISHGSVSRMVTRPTNDANLSCIHHGSHGPWEHSIRKEADPTKYVTRACTGSRNLDNLTGVNTCRWAVFQGCQTGPVAQRANTKGVATTVGFAGKLTSGGTGNNSKSRQYNFSARYWKSLWEGKKNSTALYDGAAQVVYYHGKHFGYASWERYGRDVSVYSYFD